MKRHSPFALVSSICCTARPLRRIALAAAMAAGVGALLPNGLASAAGPAVHAATGEHGVKAVAPAAVSSAAPALHSTSPNEALHPFTIRFVAEVNSKKFDCNATYSRVGRSQASWQPQDLRMYVSDVTHVPKKGPAIALPLVDDGVWQQSGVALLDFEDKSGTCQNGTAETNMELKVMAPLGHRQGLRFHIGVPFELNHADASAAKSPLDQAGMFWSWQAGYKFFALDGRVDNKFGHSVHIGSIGCQMDTPNHVTHCAAPNIVQVDLPRFVLGEDLVVVDIGHLLATTDLRKTATATHNGCMAEPSNPACGPLFTSMGLNSSAKQHFVLTRKQSA